VAIVIPTGDYPEDIERYCSGMVNVEPQQLAKRNANFALCRLENAACLLLCPSLCSLVIGISGCSPQTDIPLHNDATGTDTSNTQVNNPPVISSEPILEATPDNAYVYQASANDVDEDDLSWQLIDAPAGLAMDRRSGLIYGMITSPGDHLITLAVADGQGASVEQTYTVRVRSTPIITSLAPGYAFTGSTFRYQFHAYDPGQLDLGYSMNKAPTGMSIAVESGMLEWADPIAGVFEIELTVSNNLGHSTKQAFLLQILDEQDLTIVSRALTKGYVSEKYEYQVGILTTRQSGISYSLLQGPPGMNMDVETGQISWIPQIEGNYHVEIQVMNEAGYQDTQDFLIDVTTLEKMDMMFNGQIDTLFDLIASGHFPEVVRLLTAQAVVKLLPVFRELQPFISSMKDNFDPLERVMIDGDIAEYILPGTQAGETQLFIVTFIRDSSGMWKIQSM
jgi:hypothetical protein